MPVEMVNTCIQMLHAEVIKTLDITIDQYIETLAGWDIQPIIINNEHIGASMMQGHEIHVALQAGVLPLGRQIIRQVLDANIIKHGYLTTTSDKDDKTCRLLHRLGFYCTGEQDGFLTHRIDKTKLQGIVCHQQ